MIGTKGYDLNSRRLKKRKPKKSTQIVWKRGVFSLFIESDLFPLSLFLFSFEGDSVVFSPHLSTKEIVANTPVPSLYPPVSPWFVFRLSEKGIIVVQNNQESRCKYWVIRSSVHSFARLLYCTHSFSRSRTRYQARGTVHCPTKWMIKWLFMLCFFCSAP